MSLFSRKPRSLHERHAAAHAVGQNIRGIFHDLAEDDKLKLFHELKQAGAVITAWMEDLIFRGEVVVEQQPVQN